MNIRSSVSLSVLAVTTAAGSAFAGFAGQPILGPLTLGSSVNDTLVGKADDNDGFTSGDHIFFIWDGGDDAWQLNWPGGDMTVQLSYNNLLGDPDLFLYSPGAYDDTGDYSILNTGLDEVTLLGAAAGTYYIVVDTTAGNESAYNLTVIPTPSAGLIAAAGFATMLRRRRV